MLNILLTVAIQTSIIIGLGIGAYFLVKRMLNQSISHVADILVEIFQSGPTKQAMSILGKKSGEVRAQKAVVDDIATKALSGPQLAGIKMIGKQIGIDVDQMIEDHGAVETLAGLQQIAGMLGIDVMQLLQGGTKGLKLPVSGNEITNPYLGS